ncbi:MAG TPA: aldo/keto reductase [Paenalcaligenes sp.]|nr:aldo/keto reductase [Paenalcaligenes sp.]
MQARYFLDYKEPVSAIGQGSWYIDEVADRQQVIKALQQGIDAGLTHIDTAEMYGSGEAEKVVGEAIRGRRSDVFLVSKVLPYNASYDATLAACNASLKRLETDYLDSYLLHWRGSVPLAETIEALEHLCDAGKIRTWGVSNFDVADLEEALAIAGPNRIACNQVLYHLEERTIEHEIIPWCKQHGVQVVAYSPFGHDQFPWEGSPEGQVLAQVAQRYEVSPRQIALAFLCRHDHVLAIPKSSSVAHTLDNAKALKIQLQAEDIALIDEAFALQAHPGYLPMI